VKEANLALRFGLELCLLAALAAWGFGLGGVTGVAVGLAAPVAAAALWGLVIAPKAPNRLADPWRLLVELVLFGLAVAALAAAGYVNLAAVLAVAVVVSETLGVVWRQRAVS
jgi:Protein of unknown function (DUF2568)